MLSRFRAPGSNGTGSVIGRGHRPCPPGPGASRLHCPLDGLRRDGHADLLGDPERPLAGGLQVTQSGRTDALGGSLLHVGYGDDRLVLLARPCGLAFHDVTQPDAYLLAASLVPGTGWYFFSMIKYCNV